MLVACEIFLLAITLRMGAAGVLFVPRSWGRSQCISSFILAWLTGIGFALFVAAAVKPAIPHPGWGMEGEKNYDSFIIINVGFWLSLLGSAIGSWLNWHQPRSLTFMSTDRRKSWSFGKYMAEAEASRASGLSGAEHSDGS
jgi:hypothetical protein